MRYTLLLTLLFSSTGFGGTFLFAEGQSNPRLITHPTGYTGSGGTVQVEVCIVPGTANANDMVTPIQNVIRTWNGLEPKTPNLALGGDNSIPPNTLDYESVVLHELGHCIGLAHPNLASESGVSPNNQDFTKSLTGSDNKYDLDAGGDGVIGSRDDPRGDDINLHWFRMSNNNPFTLANSVDTGTYAVDINSLPGGSSFPANADRDVGATLNFPNSEAVMQQGQRIDEAQRAVSFDDAAMIQLGRSGLDETAGTSDDYTIELIYGGISDANSCDITVEFSSDAGFAFCEVSGIFLSGNHVQITSGSIEVDTDFNWYFNPTSNAPNCMLDVTPASVDFAQVELGQQDRADVTLANPGSSACTVTALDTSGSNDFRLDPVPSTPVTIPGGNDETVTLTYTPTTRGDATGTLAVSSDDPASPATVALSGEGTACELTVNPTSLDFGAVDVGTPLDQTTDTITVENTGNSACLIDTIDFSGARFFTSTDGARSLGARSLDVNETDTIEVIFDTRRAGITTYTGTVTLTSNDPGNPTQTVTVSGSGTVATTACDVDGDTDVDIADFTAIFQDVGQSASGPNDSRDPDGDGQITTADVFYCVLQQENNP
jgi:hypothetical protein